MEKYLQRSRKSFHMKIFPWINPWWLHQNVTFETRSKTQVTHLMMAMLLMIMIFFFVEWLTDKSTCQPRSIPEVPTIENVWHVTSRFWVWINNQAVGKIPWQALLLIKIDSDLFIYLFIYLFVYLFIWLFVSAEGDFQN